MALRQRGVILVVVLLVLAVVAAIATEIMYRSMQTTQRTINLLQWDKRYQYAMAAEQVAIQALIDDLENDDENGEFMDDCVDEKWAIKLPPTPYHDAFIAASVQDLQGRFNLNSVVADNQGAWEADVPQRDALFRLLGRLLDDGTVAGQLADEMVDWVDSDLLVSGANGAEDAEYRNRRTPNMPVLHESEMRALRSFPMQQQSNPLFWSYFTAIPTGVGINVNTAPAPVLEAVLGQASGAVQAIVESRQQGAYTDINDVLAQPEIQALPEDQRDALADRLTVASEYFQVVVDVRVEDSVSRLVTRIHRPLQGQTRVYSRAVIPILGPLEPQCHAEFLPAGQSAGPAVAPGGFNQASGGAN